MELALDVKHKVNTQCELKFTEKLVVHVQASENNNNLHQQLTCAWCKIMKVAAIERLQFV